MEKKVYIQPSLKATELDEDLLAGMSGGGDVNIPGDDSGDGDVPAVFTTASGTRKRNKKRPLLTSPV